MKGLLTKFGYKKVRYETLNDNNNEHLAVMTSENPTIQSTLDVVKQLEWNSHIFGDSDDPHRKLVHEFSSNLLGLIKKREELDDTSDFSLQIPDPITNDKVYSYLRGKIEKPLINASRPIIKTYEGYTVTDTETNIPGYTLRTITYDEEGKLPEAEIINTKKPQ